MLALISSMQICHGTLRLPGDLTTPSSLSQVTTLIMAFLKTKTIIGLRKVLIINFVDNWRDTHELYA